MLKQRPNSHMDSSLNYKQQQRQKSQHDRTTRQHTFQQDDLVMVHSFNKGPKDNWLPATVVSTSGGKSYKIKLTDGRIMRRHTDHIGPRQSDCIPDPEDDSDDIPMTVMTFLSQSLSSHLLVEGLQLNFTIHRDIVSLQNIFGLKERGI